MLAKSSPDLSWADDVPLRTAVIVYDTRFGKTERVAQAIARGIRKEGVPVDVLSVSEAEQRAVDGYDLLVLGSPSNRLVASRDMVRFLATLKRMPRLKGHYGYAFELRVRHHPGGASREIEDALLRLGLRIPGPRSYATVEPPSSEPEGTASRSGDSNQYRLAFGTEDRFENLGSRLVRVIRGETEGPL